MGSAPLKTRQLAWKKYSASFKIWKAKEKKTRKKGNTHKKKYDTLVRQEKGAKSQNKQLSKDKIKIVKDIENAQKQEVKGKKKRKAQLKVLEKKSIKRRVQEAKLAEKSKLCAAMEAAVKADRKKVAAAKKKIEDARKKAAEKKAKAEKIKEKAKNKMNADKDKMDNAKDEVAETAKEKEAKKKGLGK